MTDSFGTIKDCHYDPMIPFGGTYVADASRRNSIFIVVRLPITHLIGDALPDSAIKPGPGALCFFFYMVRTRSRRRSFFNAGNGPGVFLLNGELHSASFLSRYLLPAFLFRFWFSLQRYWDGYVEEMS
jgi:hypothetical protein